MHLSQSPIPTYSKLVAKMFYRPTCELPSLAYLTPPTMCTWPLRSSLSSPVIRSPLQRLPLTLTPVRRARQHFADHVRSLGLSLLDILGLVTQFSMSSRLRLSVQ